MWVSPLVGGGFWVAFAQICAVYFGVATLLHVVVPALLPVRNLQTRARKPRQLTWELVQSIGPLAVKAAILTIVEDLYLHGYSKLYSWYPLQQPQGPHWALRAPLRVPVNMTALVQSQSHTLQHIQAAPAVHLASTEAPAVAAPFRGPWGPFGGPLWREVAWCLFVVALLDMLHDTWFYWTHRLLHWGPLYRYVHYMHHWSTTPTAFTGYSFHILEAFIVFANEVLVCFLFPIPLQLHRTYHLFTTMIHNGGHAGYEIAPFIPSLEAAVAATWRTLRSGIAGLTQTPSALNTVQHHEWHHRYPSKHFSLYFTHWDRWCGTLHDAYDASVATSQH